jgi:hypothetical protein
MKSLFSSPSRLVVAVKPMLSQPRLSIRFMHSLPSYIHTFPDPTHPARQLLTLLPTSPPTPSLALGTSSSLPPTPSSFTQNAGFLPILQSVLAQYAVEDLQVIASAATYASEAGFAFQGRRGKGTSSGAGPTASQGGMGGGGRGGFVHVSDTRRPPDWGRIADPEDIFGSLEVDSSGNFVGEGGSYQESGTYRLVTNDGM